MKRFLLASVPCALAAGVTALLACGAPFSAVSPGADGGAESSLTGDGPAGGEGSSVTDGSLGQEGASGEGGLPESGPPPGSVVYVSNAGDDANDGIDPTKPKKTIVAALTRAQAIGAAASVHVCKGTYAETALSLTLSIPLLGSYDCSTWKRTATYGFPGFDGVNESTVGNANPQSQSATLVITGGVTASAVVDGFLVAGATTSAAQTLGVEIEGTASPVLSNDVILGGGGNGGANSAGSIAVEIVGGSPELELSVVSGGNGGGNPGSEGVVVAATSSPNIHDDLISGGTGAGTTQGGSGAYGAVGLVVAASLAEPKPLKNLGVTGTDSAGANGSSAGIFVSGSGTNVDIEASLVEGGSGSGSSTSSAAVVISDPGGTTRVLGDRLYGGARTGSSSLTYGVQVVSAGTAQVTDCEIHAGSAAASSGASTVGVSVISATTSTITFDTIFSGDTAGAAIALGTGLSGVQVTDDLLMGGGSISSSSSLTAGVVATDCSNPGLTHLDYTSFVDFAELYVCGQKQSAADVTTMTGLLPGTTGTTGDKVLQTTCGPQDTTCVTVAGCPSSPATCLPLLFGTSWTATDDGLSGLSNGAPQPGDAAAALRGWTLLSTIPCALARGGIVIPSVTVDVFGQARTTKPTMGAQETTGPACPALAMP